MPKSVNVVCMKWGKKYPALYVNILKAMVSRNLSLPHRFVCFTDDASGISKDIEVLPLPTMPVPGKFDLYPWRKLSMFSSPLNDLTGKTLFLDLDIVIVGSLDGFFTYSKDFTIIENWTQMGQGVGNSSVYCFTIGNHVNVFETFCNLMEHVLQTYDNEQIFLSKHITPLHFWPDDWCQSYKRHCVPKGVRRYIQAPKPPKNCKIIVFHGVPNPPEAIKGGSFGSIRKYVKPAPWLQDYWHL